MNRTNIEWVKNPDGSRGYTWNPITGCLNGCPYCYARRLAHGRLKKRYLANLNCAPAPEISDYFWPARHIESGYWFADPFYPRFWPERLKGREQGFGDHMSGAIPKGIFVCDMGELFGPWLPKEWTARVLENISQPWYKEHRFYLLTKQPRELQKWSPFPPNCWVGVTATDMRMLADACYILKRIEATVKYISLEPFLNFDRTNDLLAWNVVTALVEAGIGWLIIGAQTKPQKLPTIEALYDIVKTANQADIPVFLKDNLKPMFPEYFLDREYATPPFFTAEWDYRQEMPE